ncbi:class I SAM-dependent methyltransferase [Kribbella qitaiheensis]|uniref:Class I SAM-dependent methyltransferase n=1 Tax=Kribbella qitaiheensis TaxID=1544730 RepID=A0A7G6WSW7_9ACTN|nr:class I SAM-dependent methyltransferase [Kribbella qitaiheensis]QNE17082.1 class I SAM-dependent methyltransferase [Kribbella qitaiheensis]
MTGDPFGDERLVELYDLDNPDGVDHAYYRALADELKATKILDFGCGTGLLTRSLATPGREVIGVDPSKTMLDYARKQPGAESVTWIDGGSTAVDQTGDADLVLSSGNTMMYVSTEEFPAVLATLAEALRPGGVISFESRNPAARAWEQWGRDATYGERDTSVGHLIEWMEVTEVDNGRVVFDAHNVFEDGRDTVSTNVLYFRTAEEITAGLEAAGFGSIDARAGWNGEELTDASRLFVVKAIKK